MTRYNAVLVRAEDAELASESHLGHIMGIQTALMVAAVLVVCLRLYVRMKLVRSHGSDDWTMSLAAVCTATKPVSMSFLSTEYEEL